MNPPDHVINDLAAAMPAAHVNLFNVASSYGLIILTAMELRTPDTPVFARCSMVMRAADARKLADLLYSLAPVEKVADQPG